MGDVRIVNGAGGPLAAAEVDENNHLHVLSLDVPIGTYRAMRGENFAFLTELDTAATAAYALAYILNNSVTKNFHIERLFINATEALDTCEIWAGVTRTSGGTLVSPINTNFSNANILDASIYHAVTPGALVLDYTLAKELYSFKPAARAVTMIDLQGRWVLGKNNSIGIKVASSVVTATKIRMTVVGWTWDVGSAL